MGLTIDLHSSVSDGVSDGLNGRDTGNVPVEDVESGEIPAREPNEDVVSAREHPEPWKIGITEDSGPISDVAPCLHRFRIAASKL